MAKTVPSGAPPTILYGLAMVAKVGLIVSCGLQYALLLRAPVTLAEAQANDFRQRLVSYGTAFIGLVAVVAFFVWLYRAKKAVMRLGMADAEYSPGMSVGCFFIPVVNLALPFQAARELWQASGNPIKWKSEPSSAVVGGWWAAWLVSILPTIVIVVISKLSHGIEGLKSVTEWSIIGEIAALLSNVFTIALIRGVSARLLRSVLAGSIDGPTDVLPSPPAL